MTFLGTECYDEILTTKGVIEKLSNHCYPGESQILTSDTVGCK